MARASALDAADRAFKETGRRLMPVDFGRWFTLGFITWLDQCGRNGVGCNGPGGGGGGNGGGDGDGGGLGPQFDEALAWVASHALLVAGIAAGVITLILIVAAVVTWLQSRGTFLYLDCVGTGRVEMGRAWSEHAARASSYFAWLFGLSVAALIVLMLMVVPIGWSILSLVRHGAHAGPLVTLAVSGLFLIGFAVGMGLLMMAMRSFVAPLQWSTGLSCGGALRLFGGLLKANLGLFFVYALLKIVFAIIAGIVAMTVGCLTCCCGFFPVIQQTLLQPLYYFERRWSLEILADLGHAVPGMRDEPPPPNLLEGLVSRAPGRAGLTGG